MTSDEIEQQKSVEFYAAGINAWYNTSLEHDKSIFSLSAGGIGLLITLLTTVGLYASWLPSWHTRLSAARIFTVRAVHSTINISQ